MSVSGQRCRVVLSDLCKVSVAAKSEAAAQPNCWRCLKMGQISSAEYTVSGSTNAALVGRWHLSQGCERDLERPLPLQRGSVSAGIHSESVKSEGVLRVDP